MKKNSNFMMIVLLGLFISACAHFSATQKHYFQPTANRYNENIDTGMYLVKGIVRSIETDTSDDCRHSVIMDTGGDSAVVLIDADSEAFYNKIHIGDRLSVYYSYNPYEFPYLTHYAYIVLKNGIKIRFHSKDSDKKELDEEITQSIKQGILIRYSFIKADFVDAGVIALYVHTDTGIRTFLVLGKHEYLIRLKRRLWRSTFLYIAGKKLNNKELEEAEKFGLLYDDDIYLTDFIVRRNRLLYDMASSGALDGMLDGIFDAIFDSIKRAFSFGAWFF